MKASKNKIFKIACGIALMTYAVVEEDAIRLQFGRLAWSVMALVGVFLLLPALRHIKGVFKPQDHASPQYTKKIRRVRLLYGGAVIGALFALIDQNEFITKGYIHIKGSYSISGADALQQVKIYWVAAAVSLLTAIILHVKLTLSDQTVGSPDNENTPDYVICPKCRDPLWGRDHKPMICSICHSTLEDLKGFYDRHPR